ncbi:MAG: GntR family transcriptional regulator [Vitreimonas sp.]
MATDPRTGERVYAAIKDEILSGELRLRQRLDIDTLAARFGASATPVRQTLAILSAERLVTAHPSRGYYVAFWSERELKALYEWRSQLALLALHAPPGDNGAGGGSDRFVALMRRLDANANPELRRASINADERLASAFAVEGELFPDRDVELSGMKQAFEKSDRRSLANRIRSYFRRRVAQAAAIRGKASIRALPHNGD